MTPIDHILCYFAQRQWQCSQYGYISRVTMTLSPNLWGSFYNFVGSFSISWANSHCNCSQSLNKKYNQQTTNDFLLTLFVCSLSAFAAMLRFSALTCSCHPVHELIVDAVRRLTQLSVFSFVLRHLAYNSRHCLNFYHVSFEFSV